MVYCAVCHARLTFCPPDVFTCPTGHYTLRVTMSQSNRTTTTGWGEIIGHYEDPPARTDVHPWYYEAFKDAEGWEI